MASSYHYDYNSPPRIGERSKYNKYTDQIPKFESQVPRATSGPTEEEFAPTFRSRIQRQGSQSSEYISEASEGYAYGMTRREFLTITRQRKESLERYESPKSIVPAMTQDLKPKTRNVLRRKPSSIAQHATSRHPERTGSIPPVPQAQAMPNYSRSASAPSRSQLTSGPWKPEKESQKEQAVPRIIPELDRYRSRTECVKGNTHRVPPELPHKISTQDLPPPTPSYWNSSGHSRNSGCSGYSASVATRYSESPGPGPYSRDTTPSSVVSQSPAVSISLKATTPRSMKQSSPIRGRPPLANSRFRIPSDEEQFGLALKHDTPKHNALLPAAQVIPRTERSSKRPKLSDPPSPPTRKSSNKFSSPGGGTQRLLSEKTHPAKIAFADSSSTLRGSPAVAAQTQGRSKTAPPIRPSREGAPDLIATLGDSMTAIKNNLVTIDVQMAQSMGTSNETIPRSAAPSPASSTTSSRPHFRSRLPSRTRSPSPALIQRQPMSATSNAVTQPDMRPDQTATLTRRESIRSPSPTMKTSKISRFGIFGKRTKSEDNTGKKVLRKGPSAGTGHEGYGKYAHHPRSDSVGGVPFTYARRLSSIVTSQGNSSKTSVDSFLSSRMSPVVIAGGGGVVENKNTGSENGREEPATPLDVMSPSQVSFTSSKGEARTTMWPSVPVEKKSEAFEKPTSPPIKVKRLSKLDYKIPELKETIAARRSLTKLKVSSQESNIPQPIIISTRGPSPAITSNDASLKSNRLNSKSNLKSDEATLADEMAKHKARKALGEEKKRERSKTPKRWNFFMRTQGAGKKGAELDIGGREERTVAHYAMLDFVEQADIENELGIDEVMREIRESELANAAPEEQITPELSPKEVFTQATPPTPPPVPQDPPSQPPSLPIPPRPSRLAQVGRIPQVVSRPERNSKSFSKSFARRSFHETIPEVPADPRSITEPKFIGPDGLEIRASLGESSSGDFSQEKRKSSQSSYKSHQEFLRLSMIEGSQVTTSTSSAGRSYEGTTAIIPKKDEELMEDEVWDEYDDLLQEGENEPEIPSATSSEGQNFRYENYGQLEKEDNVMIGEIKIGMEKDVVHQEAKNPEFDFKFQEAGNTAPTPTTPLSFADFIAGYGDRSVRNSVSRRTSLISKHSISPSISSNRLSAISDQIRLSPHAQVNLRVGSMTVSKWLTFGHVLFSPARGSIPTDKSNIEFRVLVIDGLGNDDWSFYASETYPSATFHNLSPSSAPSGTPSPHLPASPSNHKQVQHLSLSSPFPFQNSYFNAVILRFPPSSSHATYRTLVSEAKRTLKPGGHLEMSILDLDMVNMGPRTRRAVRSLKVNLASQERDLTPTGDTMMRLLGESKFETVKSCVVGIPVAHDISRKSVIVGREESLVEMMRGEGKDEGILRMVGKVGRWWWTRVYEGRGVWGEKGVLRECEEWATGFKLLVAYARKPIRGRGASV